MRKFIAAMMVAGAALIAGTATAADFPDYPPIIEIPDVDYGVQGSFYLRGSVGANLLWARENVFFCPPPSGVCGGEVVSDPTTDAGHGYGLGVGLGYETGTGLRADVTLDYFESRGLAARTARNGNELTLRSTLALANIYYDFGFGQYGSAAGGFGAYVGAGLGGAYNWVESRPVQADADGGAFSAAGALMTGVTYDMGALVADLGYRMVYMPQLTNGDAALGSPQGPYFINDNFIHEVRGTLRYRFN